MTTLREAAQQALEAMRRAVPTGEITLTDWMKANHNLEAALAEHYCDTHCTWADHAPKCVRAEPVFNPAPGYCKHCKQYTIEEPLPAEPVQGPDPWGAGYEAGYAAGARERPAEPVQEPVQEPYTDDVTRIMRDAGMTFHLGLPHKAVVEQMTRVVDLVYAESSIKAAQQFAAAPPQRKPLSGIEVERLLEQVIGSLPVARKLIRAVEAAHGIK